MSELETKDQNSEISTDQNISEQVNTNNTPSIVEGELNPVTKKIVENSINTVLNEYISKQKLFTADSLHGIRTKVTELVKSKLGPDEILFVDVGLDLTKLNDIDFFFRLDIAKDKIKDHVINPKEVPVTSVVSQENKKEESQNDEVKENNNS
ncbi:MAG: hypothetical protein NZZ41_01050 [Candidatus Dojkabacteria bacterium]|nr:hypothetical protein [Candidatus Dojkabacteria bacterium]